MAEKMTMMSLTVEEREKLKKIGKKEFGSNTMTAGVRFLIKHYKL